MSVIVMPAKKWRTDSDRVKACGLRKEINPATGKNWTDDEILMKFYQQLPSKVPSNCLNGGQTVKQPKPKAHDPNFKEFTEEYYILFLKNQVIEEIDPALKQLNLRIATEIRKY